MPESAPLALKAFTNVKLKRKARGTDGNHTNRGPAWTRSRPRVTAPTATAAVNVGRRAGRGLAGAARPGLTLRPEAGVTVAFAGGGAGTARSPEATAALGLAWPPGRAVRGLPAGAAVAFGVPSAQPPV